MGKSQHLLFSVALQLLTPPILCWLINKFLEYALGETYVRNFSEKMQDYWSLWAISLGSLLYALFTLLMIRLSIEHFDSPFIVVAGRFIGPIIAVLVTDLVLLKSNARGMGRVIAFIIGSQVGEDIIRLLVN